MIGDIKYCKCGCGEIVQKNYKKGHGRRGKKNSIEHNLKISKCNKEKPPCYNMSVETKEKMINKLKLIRVPEERKIRIGQSLVGKNIWSKGKEVAEETKNKISLSLKGHITSDLTKQKISEKNSGENNGMFGKTHSDEYKDRLRKNIEKFTKNAHSLESIEKMKLKMIGKKSSEDTREKMRISKINFIKNKNGGICPMHNINACKYFDELSEKNNWNLQHALNGGELHLKNLGYFVDAYDSINNIVVEYDEPRHYDIKGNLKIRDIVRQNRIIENLKCQFFRYNERKNELQEIKNIDKII